MARPARAPNTRPSSSELLASLFAPWTPVQATSPGGVESGNRRAAVEIGPDAAHDVVRRRTDRHPIPCQIETRAPARLGDERKARVHEVGIEVLEREKDGAAQPFALAHDRARHAIARRQIPGRIVSAHERLAGRVQQSCAFAAQRLRQQEPRMAGNVQRGRDETGRTRDRRPPRRRRTPSPRRRRSRPPGWWSR